MTAYSYTTNDFNGVTSLVQEGLLNTGPHHTTHHSGNHSFGSRSPNHAAHINASANTLEVKKLSVVGVENDDSVVVNIAPTDFLLDYDIIRVTEPDGNNGNILNGQNNAYTSQRGVYVHMHK